jgi:hypothetical protein
MLFNINIDIKELYSTLNKETSLIQKNEGSRQQAIKNFQKYDPHGI